MIGLYFYSHFISEPCPAFEIDCIQDCIEYRVGNFLKGMADVSSKTFDLEEHAINRSDSFFTKEAYTWFRRIRYLIARIILGCHRFKSVDNENILLEMVALSYFLWRLARDSHTAAYPEDSNFFENLYQLVMVLSKIATRDTGCDVREIFRTGRQQKNYYQSFLVSYLVTTEGRGTSSFCGVLQKLSSRGGWGRKKA